MTVIENDTSCCAQMVKCTHTLYTGIHMLIGHILHIWLSYILIQIFHDHVLAGNISIVDSCYIFGVIKFEV